MKSFVSFIVVIALVLLVSEQVGAKKTKKKGKKAQAEPEINIDYFVSSCHDNRLDVAEVVLEDHPHFLNKQSEKMGKQTCLMAATLGGSAKIVEWVLTQEGINTMVPEGDGYTPMHGAGFQGRGDIAKMLIDFGMDANDRHSDGYTPLHRSAWGIEERHTGMVQVLLDAGVDPEQKSADGKTAMDLSPNDGTKRALQEHIAGYDQDRKDETAAMKEKKSKKGKKGKKSKDASKAELDTSGDYDDEGKPVEQEKEEPKKKGKKSKKAKKAKKSASKKSKKNKKSTLKAPAEAGDISMKGGSSEINDPVIKNQHLLPSDEEAWKDLEMDFLEMITQNPADEAEQGLWDKDVLGEAQTQSMDEYERIEEHARKVNKLSEILAARKTAAEGGEGEDKKEMKKKKKNGKKGGKKGKKGKGKKGKKGSDGEL